MCINLLAFSYVVFTFQKICQNSAQKPHRQHGPRRYTLHIVKNISVKNNNS